jgi:hypothetical protein
VLAGAIRLTSIAVGFVTVITASSVYSLPGGARLRRATVVRASAWLAVVIVLVVYVWIASAGTWTRWPAYGSYYQDLADGFRKGQLALATKPDPRLLALADPYDPATNEGLRIHDVSLYKGRFYLYWGPVPAVLLAAANVLGLPKLGDQYLVFAFAAGALIFASRLILRLWYRHFSDAAPAWAVPLAILTVGLANPGPFNLGRASIYEASILAAQMFLIGGICFAVSAFRDRRASPGRLCVAGLMLACAVGSRTSVVLPVAGVTLLTAWQVMRLGRRRRPMKTRDEASLRRVAPPPSSPDAAGAPQITGNVGFALVMPGPWDVSARPRRVASLLGLLAPLLVGAALLAGYNHARFGSFTEPGVRYQLAGFNSFKNFQTLTSGRNVVPNVYSYLFRAPLAKDVFPYLVPRKGLDAAFPGWLPVPKFHVRDASVAGMLLVSPFVIFAGVALLPRTRGRGLRDDVAEPAGGVRWLSLTLAVTVALGAVPALVLSFSTMRYLADWTLPLLLLATIGFWSGCAARAGRAWPQRVWLAGGAVLMSVTILVGPLLGVTSDLDQFARFNPALMKRMIEATYAGPVPGVAQISGPAGVDLLDGRRGGWWLGDERAAVDVIVPAEGRYAVAFTTWFGPGLAGAPSAKLQVAADPGRPLASKGSVIAAILTVPSGHSNVTFNTRLRGGLNRLFLSTPTPPQVPAGGAGCRRLIAIAQTDIRPSIDSPDGTAAGPRPPHVFYDAVSSGAAEEP